MNSLTGRIILPVIFLMFEVIFKMPVVIKIDPKIVNGICSTEINISIVSQKDEAIFCVIFHKNIEI